MPKYTKEQVEISTKILKGLLENDGMAVTVYVKQVMSSPSGNNWAYKHLELFVIANGMIQDITRHVARVLDRKLDSNDLIKGSQEPHEMVEWLSEKLGLPLRCYTP